MTTEPPSHCPCCGQSTPQEFRFARNGCRIVRCTVCGTGRAVVGAFNADAYYSASYFNGGLADGYADYVGSEAILRAGFRKIVDLIKRRGVTGGTLLEVGCAYGFLLQEARNDFTVHGVEICGEAVAWCHAQGLENVHRGVVDEGVLDTVGTADVIVMLDVIEHLETPDRTFDMVARRLRPGGLLVVTTGDWGSPVARLTGASWRLMTPPQHLWYFTRAGMARLAARHGLEIVELRHPAKTVPLSLILFQLARMFGMDPRAGGGCLKAASGLGVPVNLFDAMQVVLRKA
jgi:2-polyprenyl-3-methyl-5-hydroxy-6-metoxy-1,4-benzoquinol methylase